MFSHFWTFLGFFFVSGNVAANAVPGDEAVQDIVDEEDDEDDDEEDEVSTFLKFIFWEGYSLVGYLCSKNIEGSQHET